MLRDAFVHGDAQLGFVEQTRDGYLGELCGAGVPTCRVLVLFERVVVDDFYSSVCLCLRRRFLLRGHLASFPSFFLSFERVFGPFFCGDFHTKKNEEEEEEEEKKVKSNNKE